jgi:hypothetical protein
MTKTARTILAVIFTLVLGVMGRASAATVTETYDFTASGFTPSGSPVEPWTGSFTITFDPTETLLLSGALDAFSSNLPASYGTFTFVYGGAGNALVIGDDCAPLGCDADSTMDTADMLIFPVTASGGLTFSAATLTNSTPGVFFHATNGTLTPSTTPVPATLPLFATGLGALGLLGWRRKRRAQAVA